MKKKKKRNKTRKPNDLMADLEDAVTAGMCGPSYELTVPFLYPALPLEPSGSDELFFNVCFNHLLPITALARALLPKP